MEDGDQTPSSFSFTILNPPSLGAAKQGGDGSILVPITCPWTISSSRV
jgi:hypothetical protein